MADPFEEIFERLTPERILGHPAATGEGVRVAVIDSGIERDVLMERGRQRGHSYHPIEGGVFLAGGAEPQPYTGSQSTPHGTTVADIILSLAPRARLFSADVLGPRGSCDVEALQHAIRWAVREWKCHILNLSLGVPEERLPQPQRRQQFLRAIEEAYYKDVLVVAAAHNDHPLSRSYPAAFSPPLFSVDKGLNADPLHAVYELHDEVEFRAHDRGQLGPFATEPATSWAAPHLTGIAARVLSLRPGLKPFEMKTILYWLGRGR